MVFLQSLKSQAINTNQSIGELEANWSYAIKAMSGVDTKFGAAIAYKLTDSVTGGTVNVFLPKYIQMSTQKISD